jgi:hypothetical protein
MVLEHPRSSKYLAEFRVKPLNSETETSRSLAKTRNQYCCTKSTKPQMEKFLRSRYHYANAGHPVGVWFGLLLVFCYSII